MATFGKRSNETVQASKQAPKGANALLRGWNVQETESEALARIEAEWTGMVRTREIPNFRSK